VIFEPGINEKISKTLVRSTGSTRRTKDFLCITNVHQFFFFTTVVHQSGGGITKHSRLGRLTSQEGIKPRITRTTPIETKLLAGKHFSQDGHAEGGDAPPCQIFGIRSRESRLLFVLILLFLAFFLFDAADGPFVHFVEGLFEGGWFHLLCHGQVASKNCGVWIFATLVLHGSRIVCQRQRGSIKHFLIFHWHFIMVRTIQRHGRWRGTVQSLLHGQSHPHQ